MSDTCDIERQGILDDKYIWSLILDNKLRRNSLKYLNRLNKLAY